MGARKRAAALQGCGAAEDAGQGGRKAGAQWMDMR